MDHSPQDLSDLNVKIINPKICWKDANYRELLCNCHWMKSMLNLFTITSLNSPMNKITFSPLGICQLTLVSM